MIERTIPGSSRRTWGTCPVSRLKVNLNQRLDRAEELVKEFWDKLGWHDGAPDDLSVTQAPPARKIKTPKSTQNASISAPVGSSSRAKGISQKGKMSASITISESENEEDQGFAKRKKKNTTTTTTNGRVAKKPKNNEAEPFEIGIISELPEHMKELESWETSVSLIRTVEELPDKSTIVFFEMCVLLLLCLFKRVS